MDLCVFDWKAFTPIIAALIAATIASKTAFKISDRWNKQKSDEIKAIEAKSIIVKIIELEKLNNSISNHLPLGDFELDKMDKKINDFYYRATELVHNFDFFKELLEDPKEIERYFNKYSTHVIFEVVRYRALLKSDLSYEKIKSAINVIQKDHIVLGNEIKKKLISYVLYKRDSI